MDGVWVGWRSGHQLLIAFSIIGAAALTAAWRIRRLRLPLATAIIVASVPAIPTVAIDVFNAQDVTNRSRGPAFPWTLVITPHEREALNWLKRATPPDAVVQFEPVVRGAGGWAYITAFAERRMAAGLPGAMIPFRKFQAATDDIRFGIFMATSAPDAYAMANFEGIDYLFVGDLERQKYRPAVTVFESRPDLFWRVFGNDAVMIYAVQR